MEFAECPTDAELKNFLAGRLEYADLVRCEEHFVDCQPCERRLAQIDAPADALVAAVRRTQSTPPASEEPEWAAALDAMAAIGPTGLTAIAPPFSEFSNSPCIRDYELIKRLGEGGMGAVFLALHRKLHKHVALKLVRADHRHNPNVVARFKKEMRAIGRLEHENIVRAFDGGEHDGIHFLAMEYVPGTDLSKVLDCIGPLSVDQVCSMICQSARGLEHAHELGLIHRDVKPSNLMLSNTGQIKVLDLGLAQLSQPLLEDDESVYGGLVGTRIYMAPERFDANCKTEAQADIFSLGVTMLELLVGGNEIRRGELAIDTAINRKVPTPIAAVLRRMLAKSPAERPRSMAEVAEQLAPYSRGADLVALFNRVLGLPTRDAFDDTGLPPEESTPVVPLAMPVHVVAPPIASKTAAPLIAQPTSVEPSSTSEVTVAPTLAVAKPLSPIVIVKNGKSMRDQLRRIGMCAGVAILLVICSYFDWPWGMGGAEPVVAVPGDQPRPAAAGIVAPDATLDLLVTQPLIMKLIERQRIVLAKDDGAVEFLQTGDQQMPAGEYTLRLTDNALEIDLEVFDPLATSEPLQAERWTRSKLQPPSVVLESDRKLLVTLSGQTPNLLKPSIPEESGAFAVYEGGISIGSFRSAFQLRLKALGKESVDDRPHRWIEVSVINHADSYTETAVLLVDETEWKQADALVVSKGFVIAERVDIERRLQYANGKDCSRLVVPFDPTVDVLGQAAVEHGIKRPNTMSAYDALAMAFGAEVKASPGAKKLRSVLAERVQRVYDLGERSGPNGELDCLVLHGDSPAGEPLYEIARNGTVPFSFVEVKIGSSEIKGSMKLVASGLAAGDALDVAKLKESADLLARGAPTLATDQVQLSNVKPGALAAYMGQLGPNNSWPFLTQIAMLSKEVIAGEDHYWVEVTTESKRGQGVDESTIREAARILLHRDSYARGEFKVKQGWVVSRGMTFPLSVGPKSIADDALVAGEPLPDGYVSSWDVLDLLFGAEYGRVGSRRAEVHRAMERAGVTRESNVVGVDFPGGIDQFDGAHSLGRAAGFEIETLGSKHAPWALTLIRLTSMNSADGNDWSAELASANDTGGASPYGTAAKLAEEARKTAERIKALKMAQPQHRIWEFGTSSGRQRLWAEYGGKSTSALQGELVLLCPEREKDDGVWVALSSLSAKDRVEAQKGREWNIDGVPFRGTYHGMSNGVIRVKQRGDKATYTIAVITDDDRSWVERLTRAKDRIK